MVSGGKQARDGWLGYLEEEWKSVIFFLLLAALIVTDFVSDGASLSFSAEILVALALVAFVVFARSFDKLAIGKLLVVEGNLQREEEKREKAEARNDELIKNFVAFSTNLNLANSNRLDVNLFPPELLKRLGVTPADQEEIEKAKEAVEEQEKVEQEIRRPADGPVDRPDARQRFRLRGEIEQLVMNRFADSRGLAPDQLQREVRFTSAFQSLDPIMERPVVYDGYIQRADREIFVEVKSSTAFSPMFADRLYVMLTKIFFYRRAKNTDAKLVLIKYTMPNDPSDLHSVRYGQRLLDYFKPALDSDLLELIEMEVSQEDMDQAAELARRAREPEERRV